MTDREPEMNRIYYSKTPDPNEFPQMTVINLRFNWLAKFVCRILSRFGRDVYIQYGPGRMGKLT